MNAQQPNAEVRTGKHVTCAGCRTKLSGTSIEISLDIVMIFLCVNCATILADELVQCVEAEGDEE